MKIFSRLIEKPAFAGFGGDAGFRWSDGFGRRAGPQRVAWFRGGFAVFADVLVLDEPFFHFFAADVGEHVAIDFDAGAEWLAAALLHFPAECGVFDDVLFFVGEPVFAHDDANALAPTTESFEINDNFWGRLAHGIGLVVWDRIPVLATCASFLLSVRESIQASAAVESRAAGLLISLQLEFQASIVGGTVLT